jgi:hypothetical protein
MATNEEQPKKKKRGLGIIVVAIVGLVVLCGIIAVASGGNNDGEDRGSASGQVAQNAPSGASSRPTATPRPSPTPKPIAELTWEEIKGNRETMTDAQWDAYAPTLRGLRVEWTGWVTEAKADGTLWIDMDPPGTFLSVQDVYIKVPRDTVLGYGKDQEITFQGDIQRATSLLSKASVTLENCVVLE